MRIIYHNLTIKSNMIYYNFNQKRNYYSIKNGNCDIINNGCDLDG